MTLLVPIAVAFLAVLPAILIIHLLRGARRRMRVPATFLWTGFERPLSARNRWRPPPLSLLLLLQLLAAAAAAMAITRPAEIVETRRHLALVFDASASMQATDVAPSRFEAARVQAGRWLDGLSGADLVSVVRAGPRASLVASGEPLRARAGLADLQPGAGAGAVREAIALASQQIAESPGAQGQIIVFTDGALPRLDPIGALVAPVEFVSIGSGARNQAIVDLQVQPDPGGRSLQTLVEVANYEDRAVRVTLRTLADDVQADTRPVDLPALGKVPVVVTVPLEAARVTAQLAGRDSLALDDVAEVATPGLRPRQVTLVSRFPAALQRALQAMPSVRLSLLDPLDADRAAGELTVLDGVLPSVLPAGPLLILNPPPSNSLLEVTGEIRSAPVTLVESSHPLMRGVDAGALRVSKAVRLATPNWARTVVATSQGPLVLDGQRDGRPVVIFTFDSMLSGLDKSIAFPLLVSNAVSSLLSGGQNPSISAGQAVTVPVPSDGRPMVLHRPDGQREAIPAGAAAQRIDQTEQVGRYLVTEQRDQRPLRIFSVNLVDALESDIRPRTLSGLPATVAPSADAGVPVPTAEWWRVLVAVAIGVLSLEWLVFARRG